ncbi:MAG: ATP synthase F1 subunit epsilon [Anaerolineales bacterium]|nr:MAG: ATP synthase F1 subunit epsilon [Anaerolineales bacterium]
MTIRCEIVSQDRSVFEGDADIVTIPGHDGEMGVLPNHAPLLSTLRPGVVKVKQGTQESLFTVTGGLAEIQPDIVTILADAAENIEEIDVARAERAKREAEQRLAEGLPRGTEAFLAAEAALARSNLRLDIARRFGRANRHSRFPTQSSGE